MRIFFIFLLVLACMGIFLYSKYNAILTATSSNDTSVKTFKITEGETADNVLAKLRIENFINQQQELALKLYIRTEKQPNFKVGAYKVPANTSPKDMMTLLENPEITDIWVTIPEGLRKDEIAKIIANEYEGIMGAVFSSKEFLSFTKDTQFIKAQGFEGVKDLEGYLFPDKYLMPAQATTEYVITAMLDNFKTKTNGATYKEIIIASMLEREGLSNSDRPMIADVIEKRLNEGWLLQIDATILYHFKDWKHVITEADKKQDQPYNTYFRVGLPPTPICNPGLSAIAAAKNTKKNPYYYYIHDNDGKVYFAKTLAEHETNIANHLR